jgi:hypothetical protein
MTFSFPKRCRCPISRVIGNLPCWLHISGNGVYRDLSVSLIAIMIRKLERSRYANNS